MTQFLIGLGAVSMFVLAVTFVPVLNVTIGPSSNTVHMCKEMEMDGMLADECFDWKDGTPWWKGNSCKGARK